ncbi:MULTISPECIES: hypothetical protein [Sinorhizobium/Ensifer group]|jgi:hypothetical protein|nr:MULTISPECIES: hypothetical protein [Sinorhizobium/Ensifer group]KSV69970.1 hypothetical protein N183_04940 [Sinorhizobium sp. Sb3]KSV88007.1 hypothetical protein N184_10125 [Sinorhizobium sp. GL28]SDA67045.1 hypothetical protein SAMN03159448_02188 [Sinorhizobium sp. NFACC03]
MRTIVLLFALVTLAACSQTGGGGTHYVGGDGDYYQGIVAPR